MLGLRDRNASIRDASDVSGRLDDLERAVVQATMERAQAKREREDAARERAEASVKRNELQAQLKQRRVDEAEFKQEVNALCVTFLTKAFSIMLAYQLAEVYHLILNVGILKNGSVLSLSFDTPKASNVSNLITRFSWLFVNYFATPGLMWLTKGAVTNGSASRGLWQNAKALLAQSVGMLNAWAFKNVVVAVIACWEDPPNADWTNGEMMAYFGFLLLVLLGTYTWVIILQYILRLYVRAGCSKAGMAKKWVAGVPSALGLGYAMNAPLNMSWVHLFKHIPGTVTDEFASIVRHCAWQAFKCAVLSHIIIRVVKWDTQRSDFKTPAVQQSFPSTILHIGIKAISFVFAWMWAGLFNDLFFLVIFAKEPGQAGREWCSGNVHGKCLFTPFPAGIFPNIYYAAGYTYAALLAVPAIKERAGSLRRLGELYGDSIMQSDKEVVWHCFPCNS